MKKFKTIITTTIDTRSYIVNIVGIFTFFFGFASGAILNLYLILVGSPLVQDFRSALSYKSAIFGDGILLPIVNMIAASFILKHQELLERKMIQQALVLGALVTTWFHVNQAAQKLVNWAMPEPWHWNILGIWHAVYMFSVASFLSLFYLVVLKKFIGQREMIRESLLVTFGLFIFFILLRLDYISVNLLSFISHF